MGQERLGPSYFFISLVLCPLNSLVWYVPSLGYTRGLGWRMHGGAEIIESSTNKQHHQPANVQTTKTDNTQQKPTQQAPRDRKQYLNDYYEKNKQKMKEQIKNNEKEKTYKIRLLREINNGLINISTVRKSTLQKYNIKFDEKTNKYISE